MTSNLFTARDFGFGDPADADGIVNQDNATEQGNEADDHETLESLRRAALNPPLGLFGGANSSVLEDSMILFYEDSPQQDQSRDIETEDRTPNTRSKVKRKQYSIRIAFSVCLLR